MTRMAGTRLIQYFLTDPMGEEILEGTMGGALAGASQIGSGQSAGEIALKTAAAIAGGIGFGMLGRRLGAHLGKRMHAQPLANQEGMLASIGRMAGSETTMTGMKHQGQAMKSLVQQGLLSETSAGMMREAAADPTGFAKRYGITKEQLERQLPSIQAGQAMAGVARTLEQMPPAERQAALTKLLGEYETVEKAITSRAAGSIDEVIEKASLAAKGEKIPGMERDLGEAIGSLLDPIPPITGEHVGRAAGRFLGDEIGVLGGLVGGSMLARALGLEDPRAQQIRELEAQLAEAQKR